MADLITQGWDEYRLIDSGDGRKLERYGKFTIDRPEPQAMWSRQLPDHVWQNADAIFAGDQDADEGRWNFSGKAVPEKWETNYNGTKFYGRLTPFRHVGFFPEQCSHWDFADAQLKKAENPKLLNLFAYTGVASLLAAKAGAQVTHVDASKKAIGWAQENQQLARMEDAPIRWICEDARKFVAREGRRGNKYNGILLDPPKFGRGANKEVWNLFDDLKEMTELCRDILAPENSFLILTTYAVRASHYALYELCREIFPEANVESGELVLEEEKSGRKLSTSLFCKVIR
ncbi:MAG: class I SAM-dependent rRNA methyltransferase [Alphaproteobacteria bacterium]|nr:class I SAM-dependent rRNA methyltransferase [Alphaproteobacteria bacterium]